MSAIDTHAGDPHHDHPPHLAHHWDNSQQQFEAGKLGMWLFLATEFLLFGGLFCAYAVYRLNHPEIFEYGSQFLNTTWGAINTVVLIVSSLTMAGAVTAAQKGDNKLVKILLALTFLGGAGFMCIKYVEYKHKFEHNIVWGTTFYEEPHHAAATGDGAEHAGDHPADTHAPGAAAATAPPLPVDEVVDGLVVTRSAIPPAAVGPGGLSHETLVTAEQHGAAEAPLEDAGEPDPRHDPNRPANAHIFFGIYFCMTGLHGVHVLVGMVVIAGLFVLTAKGRFSADYFTPIDLGGLYWHVVDLIWIFLFPLLYLIG